MVLDEVFDRDVLDMSWYDRIACFDSTFAESHLPLNQVG